MVTGEHGMLLPIRGADGAVLEWAMIELQGKVESTHPEDPSISEIGTLQLAEHVRHQNPRERILHMAWRALVARALAWHLQQSRDSVAPLPCACRTRTWCSW